MTTTAERAKELLRSLERNAGLATRDEQIDRITQALHQAQNDKLEEAAQLLRNHALTHLPPDTQLIAMCARSVRSLKSKD